MAIALSLCACTRGGERPPPLVVASLRQPATALFFVAQGSGCLAEAGLEVVERPFGLGRDALALLRAGGADVAFVYEAPLLRAALEDDRLRVVSKLHTSTINTRLVAREGSGIRSFAHLRGKRIGLARGTNADFFAEVALAAGGVDRSAVTFVDLPPAASVEAVTRGELDAAVLSDPFAGSAERALGRGARTLTTNLYVETSLVVTRADVVAAKGRGLRALLGALACAERHAQARPDRARALVVARFPEEPPAELAAQLGRVTWGLGLDHVLADVLRRERDWLLPSTPGARAPDLGRIVDPRLLEDVYPESVTLLPGDSALRW